MGVREVLACGGSGDGRNCKILDNLFPVHVPNRGGTI